MSEDTPDKSQTPKVNRFYLRYLRENVEQLTHEALAEKIGIPTEVVKNWETGRTQPNQKQQIFLEKLFGIKAGSLALDIKAFIIEDFTAAYFGDEAARARLNWTDEKRKLAQSLEILPPLPKKRVV